MLKQHLLKISHLRNVSFVFLAFSLLLISCGTKRASSFALEKAPLDPIRVAVVQYEIKANQNIESFFKKIENFVKKAARNQSDVVVFPEFITLDLWRLGSGLSQKEGES